MTKGPLGALVPADRETDDYLRKIKSGVVVHGEFRRMRNPRFHRKFFALLNFAFEYWEPGEVSSRHGVPEKNFERFREDVIILAGYYRSVIRLDGSVRIEAESISFGSMDEDRFEKLYNAVLTVIIERILVGRTPEEVDRLVNEALRFA